LIYVFCYFSFAKINIRQAPWIGKETTSGDNWSTRRLIVWGLKKQTYESIEMVMASDKTLSKRGTDLQTHVSAHGSKNHLRGNR